MPAVSSGLLLFRRRDGSLEVLLAHPGGPSFVRREAAVWSVPVAAVVPPEVPGPSGGDLWAGGVPRRVKPRLSTSEDERLSAARAAFASLFGQSPDGSILPLGGVKAHHHRLIFVWAVEGDCDPEGLQPTNAYDRAAFFALAAAHEAIAAPQRRFLDQLEGLLTLAEQQAGEPRAEEQRAEEQRAKEQRAKEPRAGELGRKGRPASTA